MKNFKKITHIFPVLTAAVLVVLCAGCGFFGKKTDVEKAKLIIASDLHYLAPELTDKGEFYTQFVEDADGKVMMYSEELIEAFVSQVIEEKPDAVILSGDLTFNGEKISHIELSKKLERIKNAGIKVLVIPGNHDIDSSMAASFAGDGYELIESVLPLEFMDIYNGCGFDDALSVDEYSLSFVSEISPSLRVMAVDVNTSLVSGSVLPETLTWVEEQLKLARKQGAKVVACTHQNILTHNSLFTFGYVINNADKLRELFDKYDVICNFSGHLHIQHIMEDEEGLTEILTSAMSVNPTVYGVFEIEGNTAEYHTELVDVSKWAEKQGLTDENLLDFESYARNFMYQSLLSDNHSFEENGVTERMSRFFADVNVALFDGNLKELLWDEEAYEEWKKVGGRRLLYFDIIKSEIGNDYTKYKIEF